MKIITNQTFDQERALYNSLDVQIKNCIFDGPSDGESALKECKNIKVNDCYFNLRYPFWHNDKVEICNCHMTELCRAALWYSKDLLITNSRLHGIKALRECSDIKMNSCDVDSTEFGWSAINIEMNDCNIKGEYFMLRSQNIKFNNVSLKGKYSFQYIENAELNNCNFDTKDALWHAKHVVVKNSVLKGEYLAWYCEDVTLINCKIIGTQPFCYCKGLKLIDCEMENTDLCFEKSDVIATIKSPIISVKNPYSGTITAPEIGEIIIDDPMAKGAIDLTRKK